MLPEGWRQCRMGDLFESRRERGRPGLPLLSVTMNDGLVDREDLDRKQDSALAPEEHLLVKPGDIAYNMMRMWQGAFGLAYREGMVSPAYVVLKPRDGISPAYVAQVLRSPRILYLLWAYSHGITDDRLRLYFDDFAPVPISLPPEEVQLNVANALGIWDRAIAAAEQLVENSTRLRQALADVSLDRAKGRRDWQTRTLGEVATFRNGLNFTRSANGEVVKIVGVSDFQARSQLDSTDALEKVQIATTLNDEDLIRSGDLLFVRSNGNKELIGRCLFFPKVEERVSFSGFTIRGRFDTDIVDPLFASHLMRSRSVRDQVFSAGSGTNISNLSQAILSDIRIELPPIDEQRAIAAMLDKCDQSTSAAHRYVDSLRRQKQAVIQRTLRDSACKAVCAGAI